MAGFPAGTVSGAPRCARWRSSTSSRPPSAAAGCVGYFSANGQMDTCIVLRTALVKDGVLHVQAGAASCTTWFPRTSSRCINKAKAVVRAAEEAVRSQRAQSALRQPRQWRPVRLSCQQFHRLGFAAARQVV